MPDQFIKKMVQRGVSRKVAETLREGCRATNCVSARSDLIGQGESSDQIHILLDGWACKYKMMADGGRQLLAVHLPGEIIDLDRIYQAQLGFGVMAITQCSTTSISLAQLRSRIEDQPTIRDFLWSATTYENAAMIENICTNGRRSSRQRIAHLFSELLFRLNVGRETAIDSFRLELRQSEIADLSGLSLVHVNRTLQALRAEGLIEVNMRDIRVPNRAALHAVADFDCGGAEARYRLSFFL